jgi:hypothetical protein
VYQEPLNELIRKVQDDLNPAMKDEIDLGLKHLRSFEKGAF